MSHFASGNGLDVLSIDDHQLTCAFQQIVDGLPIHPCRFHRNMGTLCCLEPIAQSEKSHGRGTKTASLFSSLTCRISYEQANNDHFLVNINPSAIFIANLHLFSPWQGILFASG